MKMRNQRIKAAQSVAEQLFAAEAAIDAAIQEVAKLNAMLPAARIDASLSATVGQSALEATNASLAQLVRARGQMVEAHACLDNVKTQIGLREVAFGMGMKALATTDHLHVIASSEAA